MSNARDFIMFGRTVVYFVMNYVLCNGIVENVTVKEWIDEHNIRHYVDDKFTIKHKIGPNEYEYLELDKKDVFFTEDMAKDELIRLLREYIQFHNEGKFILEGFEDEVQGYLYESDADVFKDNCIVGNLYQNALVFSRALFDPNKKYKLILKYMDKVWATEVTQATIYDGLDETYILADRLTEIPYPEDYGTYKIAINDVPLEYNNYHIQLNIGYSDDYVAISSNLTTNIYDDYISINNDRFEPIESDGDLAYWIPEENKHYKLFLQIIGDETTLVYEYNDFITKDDFLSDMPLSFASFNGED